MSTFYFKNWARCGDNSRNIKNLFGFAQCKQEFLFFFYKPNQHFIKIFFLHFIHTYHISDPEPERKHGLSTLFHIIKRYNEKIEFHTEILK